MTIPASFNVRLNANDTFAAEFVRVKQMRNFLTDKFILKSFRTKFFVRQSKISTSSSEPNPDQLS